jgi:probable rRNA maturation factor
MVSDKKIREINRKFLGRNQPTDVISFHLGKTGFEESVWGEIYISEERAREQAKDYGVAFQEELARLVIHGILHLVGYDDADEISRKRMEKRENHFLNGIASKEVGFDSKIL